MLHWWHIWPISGGWGDDYLNWKLVHTWQVTRQPRNSQGDTKLKISLSSFCPFVPLPLFHLHTHFCFPSNQNSSFLQSVRFSDSFYTVRKCVKEGEGAELRSNIPFINHAVRDVRRVIVLLWVLFKERDFITGLTHRAAPLFYRITHSSGSNQSGNTAHLLSQATISVRTQLACEWTHACLCADMSTCASVMVGTWLVLFLFYCKFIIRPLNLLLLKHWVYWLVYVLSFYGHFKSECWMNTF